MNIFNKKPEFIAATCQKCGGRLELDVNFEVAYCSECGTQSIIRNAKKRVKRTPLDKIIEFTEKQCNVRRQDHQQAIKLEEEKKKEKNKIREKKRLDRKLWWSKHWLKVVIITLIVFVISLVYDYLMG